MRRRPLLLALGAAFAVPGLARAQQPARPTPKVYKIGVLEGTSMSANRANFEAFRDGLRDLGYVQDKNIVIEYRSADGRVERFPELAAELAKAQMDILVARGTPAALAAKATGLPVVMSGVADPAGPGLVASLAKPGGNITGLATLVRDLTAHRMGVLKELVPKAERIGNLLNLSNPAGVAQWKETETVARMREVEPVLLDVREPKNFAEAFEAAVAKKVDAILVNPDPLIIEHRRAVAEFAARHKIAAIYAETEFVEVGGLISYGVYYPHLYYRAAAYVDRIFKGAKPAELPVEQPTRFLLYINVRAAKNLGLAVPPSLLQRADRIIG
ncbi:MAG: ABC transporter substrate-binding protein [Betaproteobacteria bacterium]